MRRLLVVLVLLSAGCVSDLRRVADATAAHHYIEALYEQQCVQVVGPPKCADWQKANDELKREFTLCNETRQIGHLPKIARKRLSAAQKKVEVMP